MLGAVERDKNLKLTLSVSIRPKYKILVFDFLHQKSFGLLRIHSVAAQGWGRTHHKKYMAYTAIDCQYQF